MDFKVGLLQNIHTESSVTTTIGLHALMLKKHMYSHTVQYVQPLSEMMFQLPKTSPRE